MLSDKKIMSIIEGILFAWSEPVSPEDLSFAMDLPIEEIKDTLDFMVEGYKDEDRGLRLIRVQGSYQLNTKPENYDYISKFVSNKNKKSLSNASLETLAIIAYKQPVTKVEVESIRGVKCDSTIRGLVDMGLIRVAGQLDKIGKPNIYETTDEFLKKVGIPDINQLPKIEKDMQISMDFMEEE